MFFDFNVRKNASRGQMADAASGKGKKAQAMSTTEALMPLRDVEGPFLRCTDGSTIVYLTYPGDNLSLKDDRQKAEYAARNAAVLTGVTADVVGIWVLPESVSSRANLTHCTERIRMERAAVSRLGGSPESIPHKKALQILESYMLPQLQQASVSSDDIVITTYVGLKFFTSGDREINNSISNFQQAFERQIGRTPRLLGTYEVLDLIDTWVKGAPTGNRSMGPKVIMPSIEETGRN